MSDHPFENTYDLSNEQLLKLEEAEDEMLKNNLGKAEDILLEMLDDDDECIPVLNNLAHLYGRHFSDFEKAVELLSLIHISEPTRPY
mgnify:CR=1 FL=1